MIVPSVNSETVKTDDQPERVQPVDQPLAELRLRGKILVDMQGLCVHRQRRKEDVVHLGDGASQRVFEGHPNFELVKIFSRHDDLLFESEQV
jgi:hypothetical protein